jgi:hypothetical protein
MRNSGRRVNASQCTRCACRYSGVSLSSRNSMPSTGFRGNIRLLCVAFIIGHYSHLYSSLSTTDPFAVFVASTILSIASGYLYHRQPWLSRYPIATTVSDKIYRFYTSLASVSSELAKDVSQKRAHIAKRLYGEQHLSVTEHSPSHSRKPPSPTNIQRARECGNWGDNQPSELFLQFFHNALCSLEYDPLAGMVSPSLMGSNGVLPVTVIVPVPDRPTSSFGPRSKSSSQQTSGFTLMRYALLSTLSWSYQDAPASVERESS